MDQEAKTREARLRRAAERQGMILRRSRRRDPRALTYGRYWIVATGGVIGAGSSQGEVGDPPGMSMDEVETYLAGGPR
jgi:hypothetical protein